MVHNCKTSVVIYLLKQEKLEGCRGWQHHSTLIMQWNKRLPIASLERCDRLFKQHDHVSWRLESISARFCLVCWKYIVSEIIIKWFCPTNTYLLIVEVVYPCRFSIIACDIVASTIVAIIIDLGTLFRRRNSLPPFLVTAGFARWTMGMEANEMSLKEDARLANASS